MSVSANSPCASERFAVPPEPVLPLTVEQYHEMARAGILVDGDRIELLQGWLVGKMTKDPPHTVSVGCIHDYLATLVGEDWHVRIEGPVTTGDSEPEPDLSVVRGQRRDFTDRHPGPGDVVLLIEVADTSLDRDRGWKKRIYAAANIPVYWIVNLVDRQIEVLTQPSGPGSQPSYASTTVFLEEDSVPVVWDGQQVGRVAARDLLP